ncbi:START domain [Trinorchestia longiramus]|nr:START domain [Trinorchestia longiramus]
MILRFFCQGRRAVDGLRFACRATHELPPNLTPSVQIEASESCKWLRAAGFPQYAQMYEELRFPLDLSIAERDHSFLEPESMNALFRRLKILNRCARIRLDHQAPNKAEESEDEEQQCALSSNWLFERHSGRWSRVGTELEVGKMLDVEPPPFKRSGSERIKDSAKALLRRMESMKTKKKRKPHREGGSLQISRPLLSSAAAIENRVAELGCIDLQQEDGATDVPSRMITAPRHRSLSRHAHSQGEDSSSLTSDQSQNSTPLFRSRRRKRFLPSQDDTCARGGDLHSDMSGGKSVHSVKSGGGGSSSRSGGSGKSCDSRGSDAGAAFSDSECSLPTYRSRVTPCDDDKVLLRNKLSSGGSEDSYCRHTPLQHSSSVNIPHGLSGTPPTKEQMLINNRNKIERRESSPPSPDDERHSIYDNVPIIICNRTYQDYRPDVTMDSASTSAREGSGSSECCTADSRGSPCPSNVEQDVAALLTPSSQHLEVHRPKRRNTVERWHSFNDGNKRSSAGDEGMHISHFSAGQMLILRKRALLRLTALMEHHCPSRPTWNWELPKFMTKRFRPSENKTNINTSSQVFGVALQVTQRKTGFPLPPVITDALRYLDQSCSDQVGLFRKPGVRSRIQKLRELIDQGEAVDFATYGAFDVADMVKTYFRELPEVLLTNKISEAFLAIFHYLPETDRMEAMQCALLMLPDENREALMTLLTFLDKMASNSHLNQMTASNLAVCLAPSLFHLCVGGSGVSPLRRKNVSGSPEQKDLNDNKAAHVCLQMMIQKVHLIDFISAEMLTQISFTYLETSQPVHVEDLGMTSSFSSSHNPSLAEAVDGSPSPQHSSDWAAYMDSCIAALIKEVKEKNRAYVSLSSPDPDVEVIYRKVGDGHPLRLWKVTTDVEAPPAELLNRVLQERHLWDDSLAKWRTIARLDRQSDVWQYLTKSMLPKPSNDFCVLRCWRSDMGRVGGSCALVETSVEHPDAKLVDGCTRGIVLVSRYFIQPCGSGKSRVTHVSRIDLRGRSPEWYNKNYGALAARKLAKLRDSFKHFAEGPESKV